MEKSHRKIEILANIGGIGQTVFMCKKCTESNNNIVAVEVDVNDIGSRVEVIKRKSVVYKQQHPLIVLVG